MTTVVNLTRKRGDSYPIVVNITDSAGSPVDITGATFLLTVDPAADPAANTNNEFQSTGSIVGSAVNGVVTFPITEANADLLGEFFYDVQMISAGDVYTVAEGSITFDQDITKDVPA